MPLAQIHFQFHITREAGTVTTDTETTTMQLILRLLPKPRLEKIFVPVVVETYENT